MPVYNPPPPSTPSGPAGGDLAGTYPDPTLGVIGAATGPLGGATVAPIVTIDAKGRVTALSSAAITGTAPGGSAGGDLTGTYPNPTLAAIGSATGPIGDATHTPVVTIDTKGRVTALTSQALTAVPSFATPAIALGSAAAAGAASTVIRSDGTIAAFDTTAPTTQAFGDAAAVGTAAFAARRDHVHAMMANPTPVLFDSTLVADTASIDTGAGGIAGGFSVLEVWIIARTDDAGATAAFDITVNNDGSSIYDSQVITGLNTTASSSNALAQAKWAVACHGSGGTSGYASIFRLTIPGYTQTNFNKQGEGLVCRNDATAGNNIAQGWSLGYRSTTAISRMKVAAQGAAKMKAGSRLLIYGR